jgi:hypothetical protein
MVPWYGYLLLITEIQLRSGCVGFQEEVPGVWTIGRRLAGGVVAGAGGGGGVVVLLLSTTTKARGRVQNGWDGGIYLLLRALKNISLK